MTWIQTLHAQAFDYIELLDLSKPQPIDLREIAWCLAHKPRYGAHTRPVISVAEHSIRVGRRVAEWTSDLNTVRCALMHDAPEAYIGDVSRPMKSLFRHYGITLFDELEAKVEQLVADKYGLHWTDEIHALVKAADNEACAWEKKYVMGPGPREAAWWSWLPKIEPSESMRVWGQPPEQAFEAFLEECVTLGVVGR